MSPRTIRVTLAYDGTDFCGWQIQRKERTVQAVVEEALRKLHSEETRVHAAGRTDSGVHACGQVISFSTDSSIPGSSYAAAMNSHLPRDVRALRCSEVPDEFHARYSAIKREYKYRILNSEISDPIAYRYALTIKKRLSIATLNRYAASIVGEHDFTTFSAVGDTSSSKIRAVRTACFLQEGRYIVFQIAANAFLWKMVRSLVGTILECADQGAEPEAFAAKLSARDRNEAGTTAPSKGLTLQRVYYGN